MKAVRICLQQNTANYRKEETLENRMTYPLPPYSTVIGAIHAACDYKEYHEMQLSIQGKFGGIVKKVYTNNIFLNSLQNDRGIMVKMKNPDLMSNAFIKVAEAKKSQGSDFRLGKTIQVYDEKCLAEYRELKDLYDRITAFKKGAFAQFLDKTKCKKKKIEELKIQHKDNKIELDKLLQEEKIVKTREKYFKGKLKEYENEKYTKPISQFRTLTRAPKYYELLTDVELVIHIVADDNVLKDICENVYNIKSIGRSEDMVNVTECKMVDLVEPDDDIYSQNSAYLPMRAVEKGVFILHSDEEFGMKKNGTCYSLAKNYRIDENGMRRFTRKSVLYTSNYGVMEKADGVYIDKGTQNYIVSLV